MKAVYFLIAFTTLTPKLFGATVPYFKPYQKVFCYPSIYGLESSSKTVSESIDKELKRVQQEEPKAYVESLSDLKTVVDPKSSNHLVLCTTIRIAVHQQP